MAGGIIAVASAVSWICWSTCPGLVSTLSGGGRSNPALILSASMPFGGCGNYGNIAKSTKIMLTENETAYSSILVAASLNDEIDTQKTMISHGPDHRYMIDVDMMDGLPCEAMDCIALGELMRYAVIESGVIMTHWQTANLETGNPDYTGIRKPDADHPANARILIVVDYNPDDFDD